MFFGAALLLVAALSFELALAEEVEALDVALLWAWAAGAPNEKHKAKAMEHKERNTTD